MYRDEEWKKPGSRTCTYSQITAVYEQGEGRAEHDRLNMPSRPAIPLHSAGKGHPLVEAYKAEHGARGSQATNASFLPDRLVSSSVWKAFCGADRPQQRRRDTVPNTLLTEVDVHVTLAEHDPDIFRLWMHRGTAPGYRGAVPTVTWRLRAL
jgi:hypothetical protein